MIDTIEELFTILTSDFVVGVMAVTLVITIGLIYYGAKRVEEN